jgi:glycosyltransferase involved in cell wall biosynthesis
MRLLIITHAFPPCRSSNAKRPYYLAKGFLEAGWKVDIMTSRMGVRHGDEEILKHPNLRIIRKWNLVIYILNLLQDKWPWDRVFGMLCNLTIWPDMCAPWARSVFRKGDTFGNYDRVLAFVLPASVLLSGNYSGLVSPLWTFDFQESVSPQAKRVPRRSPLLRMLSNKLENLERRTLHQAGRVVFTANSNRQAYIQSGLVPANTAEHVPYFYDEEAFQSSGTVGLDFEIGYYGNFDLTGSRNPTTFLTALAGFLDQHPDARIRTRFVFHGAWIEEHNRLLEKLQLHDVCRISKAVSYHDYLEKLKQSPVLLLVVAEAHNLFMPSKIVDYFGACRPILAFVPPNSEMHYVLVEAGMENYLCGDKEVKEGILALERLWAAYLSQSLHVDSSRTSKWASSTQVSRYIYMLETPSGGPA